MRTIIIYDNSGFIISQMSGDVREPIGIPFIWVNIPENHYAKSVDVSTDEHTPIFEQYPRTQMDMLEEQILMNYIESDYRLSLIELGLV